ncbi:hypothetical protein D8674_034269 [Pyrus ussuriensis x Pyrus communis]|uniref:Replication factor A C-terminal domain-containing protein n=1 Tax=Pyrus ussuriensis x Pyrus communis TaxID=2448454 RepID=A0A5N5I1E9_9ROSA|nr:hypothetical protein D8674_034269 [Pyrus ussuriensis x Pyrus communis]
MFRINGKHTANSYSSVKTIHESKKNQNQDMQDMEIDNPRHYVIGCIRAVQSLEEKQINQRVAYKCDVHIQNIRNEEAKITLWLDVVHSLFALSLEQLPKPIIVVFTSLRVKLYLLFSIFFEISMKSATTSPFQLPLANEQEILQIGKKVTIEELGYLDPDLYENDMFFRKGSIKQYNTMYEWWYTACPTCAKQMYKDPTSGQLICQTHPNQIPTPR